MIIKRDGAQFNSEYAVMTDGHGNRIEMKSCPRCSRSEHRLIYYRIEEFGDRLNKGKMIIQSYCKKCRTAASKESQHAS